MAKLLASSSHTGMFSCPQGEKGEAGEKGDPGAEVGQPCSSFCVTPDKSLTRNTRLSPSCLASLTGEGWKLGNCQVLSSKAALVIH